MGTQQCGVRPSGRGLGVQRTAFLLAFLISYGLAGFVLHQLAGPAAAAPQAFGPGERLVYAVSYAGVRGGTVTMEVTAAPAWNGRPAYRFLTNAMSQQPVTAFFPIDDRIDSIADADTLMPYRMVFQKREGKKRSEQDVVFQHAQGTATTIKDGVTDTQPIPPGTQHALSALYYLRGMPTVAVGSSVSLNVHHEKKNYTIHAKVDGIEEVSGVWGAKKALRVVVTMPYKGIWLNAGDMSVWVTNDVRRLPLMIRAKMAIGSVVAELREGPGITPEFDDTSARTSF